MKQRNNAIGGIFLAALTLCLFSCTNQINGKSFLTGPHAGADGNKTPTPKTEQKKANPQPPDSQGRPPAIPKVPGAGSSQAGQSAIPEVQGAGSSQAGQSATPDIPDSGSSKPAQPHDATAKKKILFERLTDAVLRFDEAVDVSDLNISCASEGDKTPEYKALYEQFISYLDEQNLFLFHVPLAKSIACQYKPENENEVASYKLVYHVPTATAFSDYDRIVAAFESYYKTVKKSMSQAEISYALYRELEKRTVYDENTASKYQRTACGAVLDGKGVCEDYSIGYKQLMRGAGIEVCCLEGNVQRIPIPEGSIAHMWNRVKLDGEWYNVDATWDDNDRATKELRAHSFGKFFLKSDDTFYGALNHTLIYDKLLPVPQASDTRYENPAYIFYNGDLKSDPFYYKGYWYYFSYQNMGLYRSRFDGSEKKLLYQKMYHTTPDFYRPRYTKLHRVEFGTDKIYFLDLAEQYGTGDFALYAMPYDGGDSSVQKIGPAPSPDDPLLPTGDEPNQEEPGLTALRTEIMLSKMKDAYFHGTESYFTAKNQERQHFRDQIQAAEAYAETAPEHDAYAAVLYGQLRGARIAYGGLPTCRP